MTQEKNRLTGSFTLLFSPRLPMDAGAGPARRDGYGPEDLVESPGGDVKKYLTIYLLVLPRFSCRALCERLRMG